MHPVASGLELLLIAVFIEIIHVVQMRLHAGAEGGDIFCPQRLPFGKLRFRQPSGVRALAASALIRLIFSGSIACQPTNTVPSGFTVICIPVLT